MNRTFFTADNHFNHANIIKYCDRSFANVDDMNQTMIWRWNEVVAPGDLVYHLGDFGFFKSVQETNRYLELLNGRKYLVVGNHDKREVKAANWNAILPAESEISIPFDDGDGESLLTVVLSHYPMRSWNKSFRGSLMLHGHCHGTLPAIPKSLDVGVDCWNFKPVMLDEILKKLFHQFGN